MKLRCKKIKLSPGGIEPMPLLVASMRPNLYTINLHTKKCF